MSWKPRLALCCPQCEDLDKTGSDLSALKALATIPDIPDNSSHAALTAWPDDAMASFNTMTAMQSGGAAPADAMGMNGPGPQIGMDGFDHGLAFDEALL